MRLIDRVVSRSNGTCVDYRSCPVNMGLPRQCPIELQVSHKEKIKISLDLIKVLTLSTFPRCITGSSVSGSQTVDKFVKT